MLTKKVRKDSAGLLKPSAKNAYKTTRLVTNLSTRTKSSYKIFSKFL